MTRLCYPLRVNVPMSVRHAHWTATLHKRLQTPPDEKKPDEQWARHIEAQSALGVADFAAFQRLSKLIVCRAVHAVPQRSTQKGLLIESETASPRYVALLIHYVLKEFRIERPVVFTWAKYAIEFSDKIPLGGGGYVVTADGLEDAIDLQTWATERLEERGFRVPAPDMGDDQCP